MLKGVGGVEGGVEARKRACEGVVLVFICATFMFYAYYIVYTDHKLFFLFYVIIYYHVQRMVHLFHV